MTYSTASNARRAAKHFTCFYRIVPQDGRFAIVLAPSPLVELGGLPVADMALPATPVAAKQLVPAHKLFAVYKPSKVQRPVAFVHGFLAENSGLGRKEALYQLAQAGINYATARTQYQVWFTAQKAA